MSDNGFAPDDGITRSTLDLAFEPLRLSIGPGNARMNWRLTLTNAGEAHIVGLRVWSDLVSTRTAAPDREDLSGPDPMQARLHQIRMLAPGEEAALSGEWQLPRDKFVPFLGLTQKILPLVRFRMVGAGILPTKKAYLVGKQATQDDAMPEALACDGALQVHSSLIAAPVGRRKNRAAIASESGAA